ncbi:MAG: DUF222 domain-containing protein [Xanthomonadales bacterium]|nr:DUF222 domain-containing protein [Xanthomonadales bacterium]
MPDITLSDNPSVANPITFKAQFKIQAEARQNHIQQLENDITTLAAHIDAAMFRWLELLREFDKCEGWKGEGIKSLAHWLNWKCVISLATAREKVRVAVALKELPQTCAAFREGRLSYSKARAITRVATANNEDVLLNIAFNGTAFHVEQAVYAWRREKRFAALKKENDRHDQRELSWFTDDDGCLVMKARFTPEQGAIVRNAIEAMMETIFQEQKGVSAETSEFEQPDPIKQHPMPISSRRADALARMAGEWSFNSNSTPLSSNDRFVINIHADIETLRVDGLGGESELENSENVSAETSRRLACDCSVVNWLDHKGHSLTGAEPLSVGRKTRTVPPSIRRALQRRDRGCRFPGCSCTRFVDAHHIHHWADGGETHINNLLLLCRHHHRLVHEGGFGLRRSAEGEIQCTTPDGKYIPVSAETRFSGSVFALTHDNEEEGINIIAKTAIPDWWGESMDSSIVVHNLSLRDRMDE